MWPKPNPNPGVKTTGNPPSPGVQGSPGVGKATGLEKPVSLLTWRERGTWLAIWKDIHVRRENLGP